VSDSEVAAEEASDGLLTPRQGRFAQEYLIDLNATQAAIRAGCPEDSASVQGCRWLANPKVSRAIALAKEDRALRTGLTQDRVIAELASLSLSNIKHFVLTDTGDVELAPGVPESAWRAVASIKRRSRVIGDTGIKEYEVELKFWDKPTTLKLAGRHVDVRGFFDKVEVTGKDGAPLTPDPMAAMSSDEQRRELARLLASAKARLDPGASGSGEEATAVDGGGPTTT